jgi:hypothetical protein
MSGSALAGGITSAKGTIVAIPITMASILQAISFFSMFIGFSPLP